MHNNIHLVCMYLASQYNSNLYISLYIYIYIYIYIHFQWFFNAKHTDSYLWMVYVIIHLQVWVMCVSVQSL